MSHFVREAFFIGIKEGLLLFFCAALLLSFFKRIGRNELRKPLFAGLLVVFLASFGVMRVGVTLETKDLLVKMIGFVFGLFYLFSLGALFHAAGADIVGPFKPLFQKNYFLMPLVFLLAVVYFAPDMAGSSLYVEDLFSMSGRQGAIFASAGAGFFLSFVASYLFRRKARIDAMRLFGLPQILLFLALVKLVAGGVQGFAEFSLIPSVQAGLMKLIHDMVHQMLIIIMIPDHPILTMTTWKYIGLLFGDTLAVWLSLILITLPLIFFIKKHFSEEVRVPRDLATGARKRSFIKSIRDERVLKSIPVFLFMLAIVSTWFVQKGEGSAQLYRPDPRPVVAEGGKVTIPLHSPAEDLFDGALHKFSVNINGEIIRLLLVKKPDNTLAVCLDACEICPPEGYGQAKGQVVCLYCRTPIPINALGEAGGCNPIPLAALVTDKDVQILAADIKDKWAMVKSRRAKESTEK